MAKYELLDSQAAEPDAAPVVNMCRWLGVSRSGLSRGGVVEALTADEIGALIAEPPAWLVRAGGTPRTWKYSTAPGGPSKRANSSSLQRRIRSSLDRSARSALAR